MSIQEIVLRGGWKAMIVTSENGENDIVIKNQAGPNSKYFDVSTLGNPYGAPVIRQEPSLGILASECGVGVEGCIVGAVVVDCDRKVIDRFSWSNLYFVKKVSYDISGPHRELTVDGKRQGYLRALVCPDKNRIEGYVGFFGPEPLYDNPVKILELEDMAAMVI